MLATLPTATMLLVLLVIEQLAEQRLLYASLVSSAFLIYVDPGHVANRVRALMPAHGSAATIGAGVDVLFGTGYVRAAISLTAAILGDTGLEGSAYTHHQHGADGRLPYR